MRVFLAFILLVILYGAICEEINENSNTNSEFAHVRDKRVKRQQQQPDPADQFFDNVFQIPISTLNAVNELIKSTRPVIRRARERIQQTYQTWAQSNNNGNRRPKPSGRDED